MHPLSQGQIVQSLQELASLHHPVLLILDDLDPGIEGGVATWCQKIGNNGPMSPIYGNAYRENQRILDSKMFRSCVGRIFVSHVMVLSALQVACAAWFVFTATCRIPCCKATQRNSGVQGIYLGTGFTKPRLKCFLLVLMLRMW